VRSMDSGGLPFEVVIAVGVAATEEGEEAGEEVSGDEERAPAFALGDVDPLMATGDLQGLGIAAKDDMAKGHCSSTATKKGAVCEEQADGAAMDFEDAVDDPGAAASKPSYWQEGHADESGR